MSQQTTRTVLRILAVTCVAVGVILLLQSLVQVMMLGSLSNSMAGLNINLPNGTGNLGFYAFLGQACVSLVGLVLYAASDLLAHKIVEAG